MICTSFQALTKYKYFSRRNFASSSHLAGKKTAKFISRFYDGTISGYISLRGESVKCLSPAEQTGNAIHGECSAALGLKLTHQLGIGCGLEGMEERVRGWGGEKEGWKERE